MEVRKRKETKATTSPKKKAVTDEAVNSKTTSTCCISVTVFVAFCQALVLCVILYPSPIQPVSYVPSPSPKMEGASASTATNDMNKLGIRLLENQFTGPESLVINGDHLFASTYDKGVVMIHISTLEYQSLKPLGVGSCGAYDLEPTCGRPLGMRIHNGYLYVVDAYLGLHRYDLKYLSHSAEKLAAPSVVFGNDLAISSKGLVFYSDSSQKWQRRDFMYLLLESSVDGRLVQYNETSGESIILSDTLSFANGVELSPDEDFVLVAETNRARIARYWLKGPKQGFWDYFATNLPGLPDNIRRSPRNTYWVGLASVRKENHTHSYDFGEHTFLRGLIAKLFALSPQMVFKYMPVTKHSMLIELGQDGKIVRSFHDESGDFVPAVSEAEEGDNDIYLGSYGLPFLTKLTLKP